MCVIGDEMIPQIKDVQLAQSQGMGLGSLFFCNGIQFLALRTKTDVHITRQNPFWFSLYTFSSNFCVFFYV